MPGIDFPLPSGTNLTALVLKLEAEIKTTVQASVGTEINVLTISIISIGGKAIQRRLMRNLLEMRGLLQGTVQVEFKGEYGIPCNSIDGDCETNFSKKVVANTSSSPTTSPTTSPTVSPTTSPTNKPSMVSSDHPSISGVPSTQPSELPSLSPSIQPSMIPSTSAIPSGQPSVNPSVSALPTSYPSEIPSLSGQPSSQPTASPSQKPSEVPSQSPSLAPSDSPSMKPSLTPSQKPSEVPSQSPSLAPSDSPSLSLETRLQSSAVQLVPSEEIAVEPYGNSRTRVAIYGDTAVSGAPYNGNGCVFIHVLDDTGKWIEQAKLVAPDGSAGDQFGYSVGIYGDTAIVSATKDDDKGLYSGSVYVFVRNNGVWTHQAKLVAPDGSERDFFGTSVGIYDDTVIVGSTSGSVHLFVRNNGVWTHQTKLVAPDGTVGSSFGRSVGVYDDTAIIGVDGDNGNGQCSGSVHLYVRNNGVWTDQAKLLAPDGSAYEFFGAGVGIYGDTAIIGALEYDYSGSAHLFVRNGVTWTHEAELVALDGSVCDYFNIVGIYGDTAIVGAHRDDDASGSVHVFVRNNGVWTPQAKLLAPDGSPEDQFGSSVSVYNGTIISGSVTGKAYVFQM